MSMMDHFPDMFGASDLHDTGQRSLVQVLRNVPVDGRYRRYWHVLLAALAVIWLAPAAYMLLMPPRYTSQFTLVVPSGGQSSTFNVESVGQAANSGSSAFSNPNLSPTENYKQLITADVTRIAAAHRAHVAESGFPAPRIKLIDQTNLIEVAVTGGSARAARTNALALRDAFLAQLDHLREDEATARTASDLSEMQHLSAKEQAAQRKLIAFQASHGLATLDQFNARIAAVDTLRDRERELRLTLRTHQGEAASLAGALHSGPGRANLAMRLKGDPIFQKLAESYSAANADAELKSGTLGPMHGTMAQANAERDRLRAALVARGHEITGLPPGSLMDATDLALADGRNALMQTMTVGSAEAAGTRDALSEIRGDLAAARARSPELIAAASQLADLQRDQRVAAAVFSSALARLDTNRLDPFASYPLVQTLADPTLPSVKTSPSLVLALAGAGAATLALLMGMGMLWLRQPLINRLTLDRIKPKA